MKENKIIAEFMGNKFGTHNLIKGKEFCLINGVTCFVEDLQYHTSWDWLMPVIYKCLFKTDAPINRVEYMEKILAIQVCLCNVEITGLHEVVCDFIQWYNQHLTTPEGVIN